MAGELVTVRGRKSWSVGDDVKKYRAADFFDWIAERIKLVLEEAGAGNGKGMTMGVTWSFPIEQTSLASGNVQKMGKGYEQWREVGGTDLKSHFDAAFRRKSLALRMTALVNDTEATLLSHAHANPATRLSLIWGTGLNAAAYFPLALSSAAPEQSLIPEAKLGRRPAHWLRAARAVLVNTELSMFGGDGILPLASADRELDAASALPGFQPLEQLTSGRYLGEVARLVMMEGVREGALFGGKVPAGMEKRWSFDTRWMSEIEEFSTEKGIEILRNQYTFPPSQPTASDVQNIRKLFTAISDRSATCAAVALFALYRIQRDAAPSSSSPSSSSPSSSPALPSSTDTVAIAFCGSVPEKHPTARARCQEVLDLLVREEQLPAAGAAAPRRRLVLEGAGDSGLLGAAVGAVMNRGVEGGSSKL